MSNAWNNVGMTMTCNLCDVMKLCDVKRKWHRRVTEKGEGMGGGGGRERDRETDRQTQTDTDMDRDRETETDSTF